MSAAEPQRWIWDLDRYEAAAEAGAFGPSPKVELIDGEVFTVTPMDEPHAWSTRTLHTVLTRGLDPLHFTVGGQMPIRLGPLDEPEPDLWVARGPDTRHRPHPGPADLVLTVEVSDSTLRFDRTKKLPRYAALGLATVWIVAIPEQVVQVATEPDPATQTYRSVRLARPGDDLVVPEAGLVIPVSSIL